MINQTSQYRLNGVATTDITNITLSQGYTPSCEARGTHEIKETIRYIDGMIVGYCKDCNVRVSFPYVPGGFDTRRLRDLAADLIIDSQDDAKLEDFLECTIKLAADHKDTYEALQQADTVLGIVRRRRMREE